MCNAARMHLWDHSSDELRILPLPDLALLVLADFKEHSGWNQRNWMVEATQQRREITNEAGVLDRLAEAWAWLNSRAFVSWRPEQDTPDSRRVTAEGERALTLGIARLHAAERLEGDLLPSLSKTKRMFLQGDYEEAVFAAFRTVEETVRERAALTTSDLGVKLMRQAFKPDGGPLTDRGADPGEQESLSSLFAGAIGTFKNPSSHRTVTYDDPVVAGDAVLLADLLLRILERASN